MATQPLTLTEPYPIEQQLCFNWRSYHIFRSSGQDELLRTLVRPLIVNLVRAEIIDRFYFVRYDAGGPHVRLRWRLANAVYAAEAESALSTRCTDRWLPAPPEFEITRYGGAGRFPASLDLFHCSSSQVLRLIAERNNVSSAWTRPAMLRLMLHLAWGLGGVDDRSFFDLIRYGERFMGGRYPASVVQSDAVFESKGPQLIRLVLMELERLASFNRSALDEEGLAADGSRLAALQDGQPANTWYLAASHIHMTANRLGLTNAEEVYLSRLLWRAVDTLSRESTSDWRRVRSTIPYFIHEAGKRSLVERTRVALLALGEHR